MGLPHKGPLEIKNAKSKVGVWPRLCQDCHLFEPFFAGFNYRGNENTWNPSFVAFCLDVRTSTFCQLMGFPLLPLKVKNFSQGLADFATELCIAPGNRLNYVQEEQGSRSPGVEAERREACGGWCSSAGQMWRHMFWERIPFFVFVWVG